ncbi:MAG: indole-3-glycerol phosphate synthase TrpC [Chitinophagaceae bacterium]
MKDILLEIITHKKIEIEQEKKNCSLSELQKKIVHIQRPKLSMKQSIAISESGIITEFKRKSPSKGWINKKAKLKAVVTGYEQFGAVAISVLTDTNYFGGSLQDLKEARGLVNIPLLRKDFIIDEYQLYEAKLVGADAVLLIASCLTKKECENLAKKAHQLNLETLLEIHTEKELQYLNPNIDMLGVNNRHLGSFSTDVNISIGLIEAINQKRKFPDSFPLLISESGIGDIGILVELKKIGYKGFLIGETFMKTTNPADTFLQLNQQL